MDILHSCIAMVGVVVLIIGLRVNAIIALFLGCIYIGLTTGLGLDGTLETIVLGFGDIMAGVGLLIGFGVLLGNLLSALGAVERLTELLLRAVGPRLFPYAMTTTFSTFLPSIYGDVQIVLSAPLVRTAGARIGPNGLGLLAGAQVAGTTAGFVFVVPGLVIVSVSGLVGAPLGTVLLYGLLIGPISALITVAIWAALIRKGFWNPTKDELPAGEDQRGGTIPGHEVHTDGAITHGGTAIIEQTRQRSPALSVMLLPVLFPLLLIGTSSIAGAVGVESGALIWIGNPVFALFAGLIGAYTLARVSIGRQDVDKALSRGLDQVGQILLITGIGGSLGAVIAETDLKDTLGSLFSAQSGGSVLVALLTAYAVAALLHVIIGSISVAAITAAGILMPVLGQLEVSPAIVALAICAGVMFGIQVNSNVFWMFQPLMGVTTRGTLKAMTLISIITSLVALPLILVLALVT